MTREQWWQEYSKLCRLYQKWYDQYVVCYREHPNCWIMGKEYWKEINK